VGERGWEKEKVTDLKVWGAQRTKFPKNQHTNEEEMAKCTEQSLFKVGSPNT
jgi:hypothetical protein